MKTRHVFSTADLDAAQRAVATARAIGVPAEDVALIARSDIQMDAIPDDQLDVSTDTVPAALRGGGIGAAVGLLGGIVAVAIPAVGITIAGAGLMTLLGAAVGAWSSALAGSSFPNPVRKAFEAEIEAGRILIVVDAPPALAPLVDAACVEGGASRLPFDKLSALM